MTFEFDKFDEVMGEYMPQQKKKGGGYFSIKRLPVGTYRIRIASLPEVIQRHWNESLRRSVICVGKKNGCPYHDATQEENRQVEFVLNIFDRSDNQLKIAFLNGQVMRPISELKKNPEYTYDSIPPYDITIIKEKEGEIIRKDGKKFTRYRYSVMGSRKDTPFTEEEKKQLSEATTIPDFVERMKEKAMPVRTAAETISRAVKESPEVLTEEDGEEPDMSQVF